MFIKIISKIKKIAVVVEMKNLPIRIIFQMSIKNLILNHMTMTVLTTDQTMTMKVKVLLKIIIAHT